MALVIDASSPVRHDTTTRTNTCAAFDPPDSPLFLALYAGNTDGSFTEGAPAYSSSPAQTWVVDAHDAHPSGLPGEAGQASIAHAVVVGSPGSTTVSVVNAQTVNQFSSILKVFVITGHDPVAPIGVCGGGRQDSGSTITVSFTASITGGQGFLVISDWNANSMAGVNPASGCTILDAGTLTGEISYLVVQRTDPDEVVGVSTTLGVTNLVTGGNYHWAYAEVISEEAAAEAGRWSPYRQQQSITSIQF